MLWSKRRWGNLSCPFSVHHLSTPPSSMLPERLRWRRRNKKIRLAKRSNNEFKLPWPRSTLQLCLCFGTVQWTRSAGVGNKYFLNVGNRRNWVVNFTLRLLYPWRKWHCYALDSNLVVHQNLFCT
jgi:hypothetical protein